MIIHLDFETRGSIDLTKVGSYKYSLHKDTSILCVAYSCGSDIEVKSTLGPCLSWNWQEKEEWVELRDYARIPENIFVAHNATFEYDIWNNILAKVYGMPEIPISRWRCTAATAAYKSLPRKLEKVCEALCTYHQKDMTGSLHMKKMSKPVPEKYRHLHGMWYESKEDMDRLISYCVDDVKAERSCHHRIGLLPKDEQKLWELDHKINTDRGVNLDIDLAKAAKQKGDIIKAKLNEECLELTGFKASQVDKLRTWVNERGVNAADLRAETIKILIAKEDTPKEVKDVLIKRREFATTSLSKYDAMLNYEVDGIARGQFLYHGANTGRWTGKGIQLQNQPRGLFKEDPANEIELAVDLIKEGTVDDMDNYFGHQQSPMSVLKSCIRGGIIPKEGNVLQVMDYAQVEARVMAWLAGEQDVLDVFLRGDDLYTYTASKLYGIPYDNIAKGSKERFIGKTASLALQYQGGARAFQKMALDFGVYIEENKADKVKNDWRRANPKVVKLWYSLNKAAVRAIKNKKPQRVNGLITFNVEDGFLTMELPSGRKLFYYDPEIKMGKYGEQVTYMGSDTQRNIIWGRLTTYGGKLSENAVQAISRDLLVHSMFQVEAEGLPIVAHVHDELIVEVPEGESSLSKLQSTMARIPDWAKGLPLECEGFEGIRYRKE